MVSFFKYLPDPSEPGALFSRDTTPENEAANNYSKLVVFTVLALVGTGLMPSWQRKLSWQEQIEDAIPSLETTAKPSSGLRYILGEMVHLLDGMRKVGSNLVPLLIAIPTLIYILMLPMNFVHPVFFQRYPVLQIRLNQKDMYPKIQSETKLFLLKQEKGDKGNLLLYLP